MSDGIAKALNTTFELDITKEIKEVKSLDVKLSELETKKKDLSKVRLVVEDKEYIKLEIMEMLSSAQEIRRLLEENLRRPPIKASDVESYSMVVGQITTLVRELRQLNIDVVNVEMNQRKMDQATDRATGAFIQNNTTNNVLLLNSKDLDAMIKDAKNNSQLTNVSTDFDISVVK